MKRRLSLLLGVTALSVVAAPQPPNILLIFCDDLTRQAISAYRHPLHLLQTPNLDRLAREGMLFERCLVPNSICGPSRAVVLTGKYSHLNGFYRNGNRFDGAQQTFPKLLQAAGYQTAIIGKWHLDSDPTGFDYWQILPGQGIYYNPAFIKHGKRETHEGYVTDLITDFSLEWLRHRDRSKPFLLLSQHKATHREWSPPLRHLGWHKDRQFAEPETLFDDYANRGRAEHEQDMTLAKTFTRLDAKLDTPRSLNAAQRKVWDAYYAPRNQEFIQANLTGKDLVRWRYQRYMHDYLGVALAVDDSVGRLLKYLDDEGLADNTLVVFSSDQGFFLGEHGWFDKRWIYEESLTTPLIIRWPGVAQSGSRNTNLVSVLDFPETFLEAAGLPVPADMQGRSLAPLLRGATPKDWRTSFYYHYYEFPAWHSVRKHYGVVTERYKLFYFYEPEMNYWTLIDNDADPHELKNVYNDPRYANTQRQLHAELTRLRTELKVPEQDAPESISPSARPPANAAPPQAEKKAAGAG
ncbi:MAG: sulfatase [Verrucomicrobia bacterium]|nr:sulfatase [Verrucomicrobiota bacterium]